MDIKHVVNAVAVITLGKDMVSLTHICYKHIHILLLIYTYTLFNSYIYVYVYVCMSDNL